jgi:hypothetical protein
VAGVEGVAASIRDGVADVSAVGTSAVDTLVPVTVVIGSSV